METAQHLREKLDGYLATDTKFKQVYEYTQARFTEATHLTAHNWAHIYRDTINAIIIGEAEHADMHIVLPAIVMHDIGFLYGASGKTHGAVGADKLAEYLQEGGIEYSQDIVTIMASCIRTHKGSMHNEKPESLEAKVVADADLLEKFGPFGAYNTIRAHTEFNSPLKVILARGVGISTLTLETPTGQILAESGRQYAQDFFAKLDEANKLYETPGEQ